MRGEILTLVVCLALVPMRAWAEPITAAVEGCVSSLKEGEATWSSPEHFIFVSFWDPVAACAPTITHPGIYYDFTENFDGNGGLLITAAPKTFPLCGRIQFDAQEYIDTPAGRLPLGQLKSLVYNTGIQCEPTPADSVTIPRRSIQPELPAPGTWVVGLGLLAILARRAKFARMVSRENAHPSLQLGGAAPNPLSPPPERPRGRSPLT